MLDEMSMYIGSTSIVVSHCVVLALQIVCFWAGRTSSGQNQPKNKHYLEQGQSTVDITPKTREFIREKWKQNLCGFLPSKWQM